MIPKLALNFTSANLDSRITFARTGNTATVVNSSGFIAPINANLPRFDYDPIELICEGILIEEARTNLFIRSDDFASVSWTKAASAITSNAINSPDNTLSGDKIIPDATNAVHRTFLSSLGSSGAYTSSCFMKAGEYTWGVLRIEGVNSFFNLSNGTLGTVGAGITATILPFTNGWYRCTVTKTLAAATIATIGVASANNTDIFTGNAVSGLYIWGAQLEAGAFPTSYIPTTTTALTRNADIATITGTNFSDFWQAGKGGASVQATPSTVTNTRPLVQFDDGTADEIIALRGNTTNPELQIVDGGTPQAAIDAGTIAANTAYTLTGWWDTNDCKARQNGGAVVTDTTATIPTVTQMRIGSDGTNYLNGTIATINYYDTFFGQPIYTRRKNKVFSSLL